MIIRVITSMAKIKSAFFCQNCGAQSPKWVGKCPSCGEWNTYIEEIIQKGEKSASGDKLGKPVLIEDIDNKNHDRINTNNGELNRVLGGGIVPGSLVLIGGEPGIGKSTLMLQVAMNMKDTKILYVTGEESNHQIKMRAQRIGVSNSNCLILNETSTENIIQQIKQTDPGLIIIDSVQTLHSTSIDSSAGSISQIRESTGELLRVAKQSGKPVVLIGHITKEGIIAGPKILEHMVDTVLQFEGDRNYVYRILRATKNRYGSTSELGIYEMLNNGLREVSNPSEILISQRDGDLSGITIAASIEGMRPMLIETQALVSSAAYGTPQRSTTGFDARRLNMLLAVLEKRSGFKLGIKDVFLNITGGIKVDDPAIDLAVICAILSSNEDIPIDKNICFAAEIGLSGEIRSVNRIDQRILEAEKQGFEKIIISKYALKGLDTKKYNIQIIPQSRIDGVVMYLFG